MKKIDLWHHILVKVSLFGFAFSFIIGAPYVMMIIASLIIPENEKLFSFLKKWGFFVNFMFTAILILILVLAILTGAFNFMMYEEFLEKFIDSKCSDPFTTFTVFGFI